MSRKDDWSEKILVVGLLLTVVAVGLFFWQKQRAGTSVQQLPAASARPAVPSIRGKDAPQFKLPSLDGTIVRSSEFQGKVVMVNFWATWCGPCVRAMPEMQKIHDEPDRSPHTFVFLRNTDHDADPWVEKNWYHANPALGDFLSPLNGDMGPDAPEKLHLLRREGREVGQALEGDGGVRVNEL